MQNAIHQNTVTRNSVPRIDPTVMPLRLAARISAYNSIKKIIKRASCICSLQLKVWLLTKAVRLITAINAVSSTITVVRGSDTLIIVAAKP